MGRRLQDARSRGRQVRAAERHAGAGAREPAEGVPALRGARPAGVPRLVLPLAAVRRRSARQHDQRAPPAGADPVRALEAGGVVVQPRAAAGADRDGAAVDGSERRSARLSLRDREPLSPAGARARRSRRAAHVAGQPAGLVAERRVLGAVDGRRQVSEGHALERRRGHRLLRPVPRDPRHAPRAGGPREGVHGPARHLQVVAQHLCHALQRRLPARLVPGARARLQDDARSGAPWRQHSDLRRRKPHRDDARRRGSAAALSPAAPPRARRPVVPRLRLRDSADHGRQEIRLRRSARLDRRRRRAARSGPTRR